MSILTVIKSNNASDVRFDDIKMYVFLEDGRELSVRLDWFPSLRDANKSQIENLLEMEKGFSGMI